MFIVLVNYKKPLEIVDQYLAAHRNFLEEGYSKNYFLVSGPRNPRDGGVIISLLDNRDQLNEIIKQDPFYINSIADFNIIEFLPVKFNSALSQFFKSH